MTDEMFKPGYDGHRPSTRLTGPERAILLQGKAKLVRRLHDAMLTMSVVDGSRGLGVRTGGTPAYIVEFGDRVGEEQAAPTPTRFEPTAAQVSDMDAALRLLEGLRPAWFKVVFFRALDEFQRDNAEPGQWPWAAIGAYLGMSGAWAEAAYDAAIVQAARRAGVLPPISQDHAILITGVWTDGAWMTSILTSSDPRQEVANLKGKSPVRISTAVALWTLGKPLAKRIVEAAKPELRNLLDHASWYKAHPDAITGALISHAQAIPAPCHMEDLDHRALRAA